MDIGRGGGGGGEGVEGIRTWERGGVRSVLPAMEDRPMFLSEALEVMVVLQGRQQDSSQINRGKEEKWGKK
ncbi:hypothetical protein AMTR_s00028p00229300 [Amborella trichopoda]|uniref:Uncharacterized protein n=1 Tax=Amborella trichopoda TaxID=13333 RepID=W1PS73_AMBTC|nr:hypothetical protein AMTR_s00028p00229300 [Amborella trichopoda]